MNRRLLDNFWCVFFIFWPTVAVVLCVLAPGYNWWFPGEAQSPIGEKIDGLFYMILAIVTLTFIGTHIALGYVLVKGSRKKDGEKALFTHGSHNLEVIWTIVPAGILLFIAFYQMDVWAEFRFKSSFPKEAQHSPIAEVTARQFEWRIRYPAPGKTLQLEPQHDDLYAVNELHVPTGRPVLINLKSGDVQHSFFLPELRVKQDAVPGTMIPVWFEPSHVGQYTLLCAELCGWGHYKMKAHLVADSQDDFDAYITALQIEQSDDGFDEADGDEEE